MMSGAWGFLAVVLTGVAQVRGTSRSAVTGATSWHCHVRSWACVPCLAPACRLAPRDVFTVHQRETNGDKYEKY